MNKILPFSLILFSIIIAFFSHNNNLINSIYGQIFEVDEEDYFDTDTNDNADTDSTSTTKNSQPASASVTSEDTDKENCINNQIETVLGSNNDNVNSDSYTSNFHFVKKFDKNGNLVGSWGTVGSQDGQFLHAHGITIDSKDNVYVSDAENCNIQKFDKEGNFIAKWGTKGKGPGQFLQPESMAIDSMDNIYVAEYSGKNIQKFDNNGKFIKMWGKDGEKKGEFKKPWAVAIDR